MSAWWENLEPRERWLISVGGGLLALVLLYLYIWEPFASTVTSLRQQVNTNRELIQWMTPVTRKIQQLKAQGVVPQQLSEQSLLVLVNRSLQQKQLNPFVAQIGQTDTNKVEIRFNQVPFDQLINWLDHLWKQSAIKVSDLITTPLKTPGLVRANITLEK